MKKLIIAIMIFLFGLSITCNAAIITFDDLENPGDSINSHTTFPIYENQGFKITPVRFESVYQRKDNFGSFHQDNVNYNKSASIFITTSSSYGNNNGYMAKLFATDYSLFTLNSFDIANLFNINSTLVAFRAYDINDNLIGADGITLTTNEWITFEFSFVFNNISYLIWHQSCNCHQFDNITLNKTSSVPIPPTILLFGSGLIGLVGISRRKTHIKCK